MPLVACAGPMKDHDEIEFRPGGFVADESVVGCVRELAVRYAQPHKRVRGLAIEYAVDGDFDGGFEVFDDANAATGAGETP